MLPVMRAPGYDKESIRHARSMVSVAPFETHMMMKEQLPPDLLVLQLFGMSEACGYVSFTRPERDELHRLQTNERDRRSAGADRLSRNGSGIARGCPG